MKNSNLRHAFMSSRLNIQIPLLAGISVFLLSCASHHAATQANASHDADNASIELVGGVENPVIQTSGGRSPASEPVAHVPYAPPGRSLPVNLPPSPTGSTPTTPTTPATGAITCSIRLDKLPINPSSSYSVSDVLYRRASPQDVAIRRAQLGTFTGNADLDRQTLQPWFGGVLGGQGSDLFDAAKTSKAYYRAMSFINGATGPYTATPGGAQTYFKYDDYILNAKMAGVIASMFATMSDPECTRYIRFQADKILTPQVAAELDDIPFVQAAQSAKDGHLATDFHEIDANRTALQKQQETLENNIDSKKKAAERESSQIQSDLKKLYQQMKLKFVTLPGCARLVTYHEQTDAAFSNEKDFMKSLTDDCKAQVNKALDAKMAEQLDLTAKAAKFEDEKAKSATGDVTSTAQADALNAKLKALQIKISDLQASLDWVNGVGKDSIVDETDAMDKLLNRRTQVNSADYYAEDHAKIAEIQQRIDTNSTKWLTYGYAGGFEFLPNWQTRYRKLTSGTNPAVR